MLGLRWLSASTFTACYRSGAANIYSINMQLTPLASCKSQARPQASAVVKASKAAAPAVSSAANSSCDIHRLLESYSRQITKTGIWIYVTIAVSRSPTLSHWYAHAEGEIDCICQQQQQVLQVDKS